MKTSLNSTIAWTNLVLKRDAELQQGLADFWGVFKNSSRNFAHRSGSPQMDVVKLHGPFTLSLHFELIVRRSDPNDKCERSLRLDYVSSTFVYSVLA